MIRPMAKPPCSEGPSAVSSTQLSGRAACSAWRVTSAAKSTWRGWGKGGSRFGPARGARREKAGGWRAPAPPTGGGPPPPRRARHMRARAHLRRPERLLAVLPRDRGAHRHAVHLHRHAARPVEAARRHRVAQQEADREQPLAAHAAPPRERQQVQRRRAYDDAQPRGVGGAAAAGRAAQQAAAEDGQARPEGVGVSEPAVEVAVRRARERRRVGQGPQGRRGRGRGRGRGQGRAARTGDDDRRWREHDSRRVEREVGLRRPPRRRRGRRRRRRL
jgi:hypothetical protein